MLYIWCFDVRVGLWFDGFALGAFRLVACFVCIVCLFVSGVGYFACGARRAWWVRCFHFAGGRLWHGALTLLCLILAIAVLRFCCLPVRSWTVVWSVSEIGPLHL